MWWGLFNDVAQRAVTLNKREQRANVRRVFEQIGPTRDSSVLDFGCGTGLFATTLAARGLRYVGFDPDERLVRYASRLYSSLVFTHDRDRVSAAGPYHAVLANCCFHHIPDSELAGAFDFIKRNLHKDGRLVLVDILAAETPRSFRHVYGLLERGDFIRTHPDYVRMLEAEFEIVSTEFLRANLLSTELSPFYSPMAIYVCRDRNGAAHAGG